MDENTATLTHTAANGGYAGVTANLIVTVPDNDVSVTSTAATARLNNRIVARASQAMTASTLSVVAARVKSAAGGRTPAAAYQFGGQSSMSGLLKSPRRGDGGRDDGV